MYDRSTTFLYIWLSIYLFTVIWFKYLYVLMTTVLMTTVIQSVMMKYNVYLRQQRGSLGQPLTLVSVSLSFIVKGVLHIYIYSWKICRCIENEQLVIQYIQREYNICTHIKNCDWVRSQCICPLPPVRVKHSQMDRQHQFSGCAKRKFCNKWTYHDS